MPLCTKPIVFFSDSSGEKHPRLDAEHPGEECESADPSSKGATAPPLLPDRDAAVGTPIASGPGDNLVTIVSTPLASAEHVSFLVLPFMLSGVRKRSRWE